MRKFYTEHRKAIEFFFVVIFWVALAGYFFSDPEYYDECILEAMAGVQSDVAAREIKKSCRSKFPKKDGGIITGYYITDDGTPTCSIYWAENQFKPNPGGKIKPDNFTTQSITRYDFKYEITIPETWTKSERWKHSNLNFLGDLLTDDSSEIHLMCSGKTNLIGY